MITTLEDFKAYNLAMEIAEEVWKIVMQWSYFEKDTVGKQSVKAVDSISANLSEGLGRYHYREAKNFAYYSRGSLFETKTWLAKSFKQAIGYPGSLYRHLLKIGSGRKDDQRLYQLNRRRE